MFLINWNFPQIDIIEVKPIGPFSQTIAERSSVEKWEIIQNSAAVASDETTNKRLKLTKLFEAYDHLVN